MTVVSARGDKQPRDSVAAGTRWRAPTGPRSRAAAIALLAVVGMASNASAVF